MSKLEAGFYVVTEDTNNPKPDRRSTKLNSAPVWKKGLRVEVRPGDETRRGTIAFSDNTSVYFAGNDPEVDLGNVLVPNLKKAEFAIGQVFRDRFNQAQAEDVLALLHERGVLSTETVTALAAEISEWEEDEYSKFKRKHWLWMS